MNKTLTIKESLNKIKFMMNYDSSKTIRENQEFLSEQEELKNFTEEEKEEFLSEQAVVAAANALAGGATIAYQLALRKVFSQIEENKEGYQQVPRVLNDQEIAALSKQLFDSMQGVGLRDAFNFHKDVVNIFKQLTSVSDLIALNDTFNTTYGQRQKLVVWINRDLNAWSLRNIKNTLQQLLYKSSIPAAGAGPAAGASASAGGGYKPVTGTADDPYRPNTSGDGIKTIQGLLGLTPDGKFGPKTTSALSPLGIQTFTNEDIPNLTAKIQGKVSPQQVEPQRDVAYTQPKKAATSQIQPKISVNPKSYVAQAKPKVQNILNPNPNMNKLRPNNV